jgi:hypothetical protein
MSERELSRAMQDLARGQYSAEPDTHEFAEKIARRDRRRVRILTGLCILFWFLGTAGLLLLVVALDRLVISIRIAEVFPQHREVLQGTGLLHHSIPIIVGAVTALLLAALFTVLLVLSSRRATLRQIHMSIRVLTEQFKQLSEAQRLDNPSSPGLRDKFEA